MSAGSKNKRAELKRLRDTDQMYADDQGTLWVPVPRNISNDVLVHMPIAAEELQAPITQSSLHRLASGHTWVCSAGGSLPPQATDPDWWKDPSNTARIGRGASEEEAMHDYLVRVAIDRYLTLAAGAIEAQESGQIH